MGKLEFKASKYGSQDSLEELCVCFVKSTLIHQTFPLFFPTGNAKKVSCEAYAKKKEIARFNAATTNEFL
jgi:hypothetical protein